VEMKGAFCGDVGLFCGYVGLFCGDVGLFCGYVWLFCADVGLFCGDEGRILICEAHTWRHTCNYVTKRNAHTCKYVTKRNATCTVSRTTTFTAVHNATHPATNIAMFVADIFICVCISFRDIFTCVCISFRDIFTCVCISFRDNTHIWRLRRYVFLASFFCGDVALFCGDEGEGRFSSTCLSSSSIFIMAHLH